ncbi:MAG: DUF4139 domain-containing protein [candidate division FCPU426 bacterium]
MRSLLFALGLAVSSVASASDTRVVVSRPHDVTVYPQGARVERSAEAELPAGSVTVAFENIPVGAVEDSLRLSAQGPKGTKIFGVRFAEIFTSETLLKRRRDLENKIRDLEDDKNVVSDRVSARQAEMDMLKALGSQGATQIGAAKAGLATLPKDLAVMGRRIGELSSASRQDSKTLRAMQEKLDALRNELAADGGAGKNSRRVEADMELAEAGTVSFSLTYQVPGAGWVPVYDLRLEGGKVAITFSGDIRQQSGEDWNNVRVELSTARPAAFAEIPDPTNWWLDFPAPVYNYAPSAKSAGMMLAKKSRAAQMMAMVSTYDETADRGTSVVEVEQAQTLQSEYAVSFGIKRPLSIPSDNVSHRVGVSESSHPAEIQLVAVPRLDQAAYIQAEVAYQGLEPLLPGQAQLFREGEYVGKVRLAQVAPGEKFKMGFGKDDQVKVVRKPLQDKSGLGFISAQRRMQWQTTIENFHSSARKIEVREQLPRSRQKEIEVGTLEISPKPQKEDPDKPGLMVWVLDLEPKKEAKIRFGYKVSFPEGRSVSGME